MIGTTIAVASLAAALLAAPPAARPSSAAPPAARIASLGLRPTETAALGATALAQLADAQRLRGLAENALELLSGASVLRHDDLRGLLGAGYLVELSDCRGEASCQLRVAAPLRRRGIASAVVGDYFAAADAYHVRLRRLDLAKARVVDEVAFDVPRAAAEALASWRAALQPLFQDAGSVRLVTNAPDPGCRLDGRPCDAGPDGLIASVPEGEHLLEIEKDGYRRVHRAITVRRGEELRVVVALEELPIQAQKAPDPNARVPTFAAPGETTAVTPFAFLRFAVGWDDVNGGDREEPAALPRSVVAREGGLVVLPRPAVAGVTVQAPRNDAGWQLRGALSTGWVKDAGPEIDSAYAELVHEDRGFRLVLGWAPSVVSSLTAGTLTLPEGFGDLAVGVVGVTASQSLGPVLVEAFVGRHKSQFSPELVPGGAAPGPFAAARVALVLDSIEGRLYGEDFPLTLGLSGIAGTERLGLDEEVEWAAAEGFAAVPAREEVRVWALSAEAQVPVGRLGSVAGEAYVGEDVRLLEGALWQPPRLDPATGRHTGLRSAGGWAQLTANAGPVELRAVAGVDRVVRGLSAGVAVGGGDDVRENRLLALAAVWYLLDHLAVGVQAHAIRTRYEDPALGTPTLVGTVVTSQLKF